MNDSRRSVVVALIVACAWAYAAWRGAPPPRPAPVETGGSPRARALRVLELSKTYRPDFDAVLLEAYRAELEPALRAADLESWDTATIRALFEAVTTVGFYSLEPAHAAQAEWLFTELQDRGAAEAKDRLQVYKRHVDTRSFDAARAFLQRFPHPEAEFLPKVSGTVPAGTPAILRVSADGKELTLEPAKLDGLRILVTASPYCGFSRAATEAIEEDPRLRPVFQERALFIVPQGSLDSADIARWNREHPAIRLDLAYRQRDFKGTERATPQFHFLNSGRRVFFMEGWPRTDPQRSRAKLLEGLRKLGLAAG